ncbi:senescence-specific cysteine protease SAG12-like [Rosa rugosa]|uniref:senescence-specific cysteine protease SAG12-like n=1 Tax=Rosa rugosa TaxID=74645 RepID=UPI002B41444F|nr:senescence-specific cysteine protease SAG12-like [Rosa rugosa]
MAYQRMNLVFILALFTTLGTLASQATSRALCEASIAQKHEQWMAKHGRVYPDNAEKQRRCDIFSKNVEFVEKFNNEGNKSYKLSINKFSDMTNEEFLTHHTGYKIPTTLSSTSSDFSYQSLAATGIPARVDWREQQAVTPIKDQARCGACWAFTVVAAVEGLTKIKTGRLISLSEQQLVDCDHQSSGCMGGSLLSAYSYVIQNGGLTREENYRYQGTDKGTCDTNKESQHAAHITGYVRVPSNSENDLLKAVSMQPVSIGISAYGMDFQHYNIGVFSGSCGTNLNHAVTAIGYGTTAGGIPYWLIKNSWGTDWGESGYMRILRNSNSPQGMCGLAMNNFYPTA